MALGGTMMSDRWALHLATLTGGVIAALSGVSVAAAVFPPVSSVGSAGPESPDGAQVLRASPASTPTSLPVVTNAPTTSQPTSTPTEDPLGKPLGTFKVTFYVLTEETLFPDNGDGTTLYRMDGTAIGKFSQKFISDIRLQGSGRLSTGEVITPAGKCAYGQGTCFQLLSTKKYPWGRGATGRALKQFGSAAIDPKVVPYGTKIYVPELDGFVWNGKKMDGCLSADDTGGGIRGKEIDIFAGTRKVLPTVLKLFPKGKATLYDGTEKCASKTESKEKKAK
jgi:3D (Asp-Asp-Asp) domain-containing protein